MSQRSHSHPVRLVRSAIAGAVALCLGLTAVPARAAAEPSVQEQVDAINEEAVAKFQAKEYDEAVRLFEQAYELQPEPNYLFNIGRIREEQGNLESAVEYYERFVKEPRVPLESRERGLERLRVLRAILEETAKPEPEPDPEPEETIEEPEPEPEPEPEEVVEETSTEPEPKRADPMRIAGYSLIGVGAAGLATGGVLAGLALARSNTLEGQHTFEERNQTADQGRGMALGADILFGVGGALAVTGVVLVIVSVKRKPAAGVARGPRLQPWAFRRGAGLSATLRF